MISAKIKLNKNIGQIDIFILFLTLIYYQNGQRGQGKLLEMKA